MTSNTTYQDPAAHSLIQETLSEHVVGGDLGTREPQRPDGENSGPLWDLHSMSGKTETQNE